MVRCFALFALLVAAPAMAEETPAPPRGASARAEVTVTILRGEEIGPLALRDGAGEVLTVSAPPSDRQFHRLPTDQIRIDFY